MSTLHSYNNLSPVYTKVKYGCSISSQRTQSTKFEQYMCRFPLREDNIKDQLVVILDQNNFVDNKHCTILCLRNRKISIIKHGALKDLQNAHMIDLSFNKLSVLEPEMFKGLKSLKRLNLEHNNLHLIGNDTFKHLSSLEVLELSSNDITDIAKGSFDGLSLLTHLKIGYNELGNNFLQINAYVTQHAFVYLKSLIELDMALNEFTALYACTFVGLKNLKLLYLRYNRIKTVENETFSDLTKVTKLDLEKNKLTKLHIGVFTGLTSLEHLILSDNKIHRMEKGAFHGLISLTILDLSKNRIKTINQGVFIDLPKLKCLSLETNKLTNLTYDMFIGLGNLKELSLINNKIQTFEQNIFEPILAAKENVTIDIRGNNLSDISWTSFVRSSMNMSFIEYQEYFVTLFINPEHFQCTRSICWMSHLDWFRIYTDIHYDNNIEDYVFENELKFVCNDILEHICPSEGNY